MKKIWFKTKRYGWGWTPATWEGWAVTLLYLAFVAIGAWTVPLVPYEIAVFAGAGLLIWVAYSHGEKPRWRWGKDD